jgi:polyhydroxyalkanoate synthesis regulator phasin
MQHDDYYNALERLRTNKPAVLSKGSYKINQDTVALEAGRKRGTIKPSRIQFENLIDEILKVGDVYNNKDLDKLNKAKALADRYKAERDEFRENYYAALNREMMLVRRVSDLEKQVNQLEAEQKVIHIRS